MEAKRSALVGVGGGGAKQRIKDELFEIGLFGDSGSDWTEEADGRVGSPDFELKGDELEGGGWLGPLGERLGGGGGFTWASQEAVEGGGRKWGDGDVDVGMVDDDNEEEEEEDGDVQDVDVGMVDDEAFIKSLGLGSKEGLFGGSKEGLIGDFS